jgi:hypothetical protein
VGRILVILLAAGLLGLWSTSARADDHATEEQQMTLPAKRAFVQTFLEINLSKDAAFKPLSIAPDLWYGVSEPLTVGLVHSGRAATGFYGGVGNGLCLSGSDGGCPRVYDNVGVAARYHFHRAGSLTVSADGGLFVGSFDPFALSLKAGVVGRLQAGSLALEFAPSLFAGLTQREPDSGTGVVITAGNKEILFLPATGMYKLSPTLAVAGQLGAVVPFADAGDLFTVALSVGAQYLLSEKFLLDLAFGLPALAGGDAVATGFDVRSLTLGVGYAL